MSIVIDTIAVKWPSRPHRMGLIYEFPSTLELMADDAVPHYADQTIAPQQECVLHHIFWTDQPSSTQTNSEMSLLIVLIIFEQKNIGGMREITIPHSRFVLLTNLLKSKTLPPCNCDESSLAPRRLEGEIKFDAAFPVFSSTKIFRTSSPIEV